METLRAEVRDRNQPKSERKRLRREGKVPGVVYGKQRPNTPTAVETKTLHAILQRNPHGVYEMDVPGQGKFPVMIREVQRDALSQNLLHVDFHQIDLDEPVRTAVALEFTGESPAVRAGWNIGCSSFSTSSWLPCSPGWRLDLEPDRMNPASRRCCCWGSSSSARSFR